MKTPPSPGVEEKPHPPNSAPISTVLEQMQTRETKMGDLGMVNGEVVKQTRETRGAIRSRPPFPFVRTIL
jgi:hypothetical protein